MSATRAGEAGPVDELDAARGDSSLGDKPVSLEAVARLVATVLFVVLAGGSCNALLGYDRGEGGAEPPRSSVTPEGCVPRDKEDGSVDGSCGVFVSSSLGSDANPGTPAEPFATLSKGVAEGNGGPVYACAEVFDEAVAIHGQVDLYGGLDCAVGWIYVGDVRRTELTYEAGGIPLTVQGTASGSNIVDMAITASAPRAGDSSIAAVVDHAQVVFERCDLMAGDAAAGVAGAAPQTAAVGVVGNPGMVGCGADADGGLGGDRSCGEGEQEIIVDGGDGGDGGEGTGEDGQVGQPVDAGGGGIGYGMSQSTGDDCRGKPGAEGEAGRPGLGGEGVGVISPAGYDGIDGDDGLPGTHGQGGGGGGGLGGAACGGVPPFPDAGPGGGGGGSGGCGGAAGRGGGAGGSSIGLMVLVSQVTLLDCSLTAHAGGAGGAGSHGQEGGTGGLGEAGGDFDCGGGVGGRGGDGGAGGGGQGGHSIGIAFTGNVPVRQGSTTIEFGSAGLGGLGVLGVDSDRNTAGAAGLAQATLAFD